MIRKKENADDRKMFAMEDSSASEQWKFHKVRRAVCDNRDVRRIDLRGLRCLIVSDTNQRLASFSVCVSCGLADGLEIAALQQAIRSSERFARFEDFIKLNNGAVYPPDVRVDYTVYGFEVHQSALTLAAIKFAEVIAVGELGSVAGKKALLTNIYARSSENEVLAGLLGKTHPFSKLLALFQQDSTCLTDTGLEEQFKTFYNATHSSLALSGKQSIDELATIAEKFSRIFPSVESSPAREFTAGSFLKEYSVKQELSHITEFPRDLLDKLVIVNSNVLGKFIVTWPLSPKSLGDYSCKPLYFVSYLLQQNRPGGLLSHLKREGLVYDIQIIIPENELESNRRWKLYRVVFMVTALGSERRNVILSALLQYLMHIHKNEIQSWIYDEAATALRLKYEFAEVTAQARVTPMSIAVQRFAPKDCLLGDRLMLSFDEQCIRRTVSELLYGSYSAILEGNFDLAIFPYVKSKEDFGLVTTMPEVNLYDMIKFSAYTPNELMPQSLDVQQELMYLEHYPNVIEKGNSYRLWYQFKSVGLPKMYCYVHMFSDLTESPKGFTRAEVACVAIERLLCSRESADAGFEFSASTKECHEAVLDSYKLRSSNAAYAENVFAQIYDGQLDLRECRSAAEVIELNSVQCLFADMRKSNYIECFVYGNATAQDAISLARILKTMTSTDPVKRPEPYRLKQERLVNEYRSAADNNEDGYATTILYYHQSSEDHNGAEVFIDILVHLLERQLHLHEGSSCFLPRSCGGEATGFTLEITGRADTITKTVAAIEKTIQKTATLLGECSQLDLLIKFAKADLRRRRGVARQHVSGLTSHCQIYHIEGYQETMTNEANALFEEIREQRFRFGASTFYGEFLQALETEDFRAWLRETLDTGWLRKPLCRIQVQ
ncbi:nardilysin-like isoform X2 [Varroa destructor]|uniref:Peptidase M16 C-terminal domain-containing protein n=1 Tax=Varroa destructor TaxID=109461 RepID=A0A7M7MB66_VARDE|nr:nardilysin-like isoform X2 [Varroa destructor]